MFTQTTEEAFLAVSYLKISHKSRAEDPGVKGLFPFFMCFIFIYLFKFFFLIFSLLTTLSRKQVLRGFFYNY